MELWTSLLEPPSAVPELAVHREREGWDGVTFADTQYYLPDPFVLMAAAAMTTSRLLLGISTSNPITRHPSVTAAAAATVQVVSNGRAILGIGRGDSSAYYVGQRPATSRRFADALDLIRALLHGRSVQLPFGVELEDLAGGHEVDGSLRWLEPRAVPVPIDVFGSGPGTARIAAAYADRLTVAVGADTERLATLRRAMLDAERPTGKNAPTFGAAVPVAPHRDRRTARDLIRGFVTSHARFATMSGDGVPGTTQEDRRVMEAATRDYDMDKHGRSESAAAASLPDDFVDRFAIVGDVEECAERVAALAAVGVDRVLLMPPGIDNDPEARNESVELLNQQVLPLIREAAASVSSSAQLGSEQGRGCSAEARPTPRSSHQRAINPRPRRRTDEHLED